MENTIIEIDAESAQKLENLDASIVHWSTTHARLSLQTKNALDQVDGLHQARAQAARSIVADAGHDPNRIQAFNVGRDDKGKLFVTISMKPEEPVNENPPAADSLPTEG